uniref:Uncharacterized protein n=1 Tax=Anguilla anguilla TaxID=7936 RepID=A0A0E9UNU7_ANGAN
MLAMVLMNFYRYLARQLLIQTSKASNLNYPCYI